MTNVLSFAARLWSDEEGATAIEYGLLAALLAVFIIGAVSAVGTQLFNTFNEVNTSLGGTAATAPS
jgi:pilus assembly protein Flp/PilA